MQNTVRLRGLIRSLKKVSYLVNKRKPWSDILYVAVVSTGRTGTKFLSNFFNTHTQNVYALHEPFKSTSQMSYRYYSGDLSHSKACRKFYLERLKIQHDLNNLGKSVYFESDGYLRLLIPVVRTVFPNYKIVHIIRNGKDWVRSFASRTVTKDGVVVPRYSLNENWEITPADVQNDKYQESWNSMDVIERGSWVWNLYNREILNQIKTDKNAITIKFEDLFNESSNFPGIHKLAEFLDRENLQFNSKNITDFLKQPTNETQTFLAADYQQWTDSQKKLFEQVAGETMKEMSYHL